MIDLLAHIHLILGQPKRQSAETVTFSRHEIDQIRHLVFKKAEELGAKTVSQKMLVED